MLIKFIDSADFNEPSKKMFYIPPCYFRFLFHWPMLFNDWLFEHHHEFICHFEERNDKISHPKHLLFTELNVRFKSFNFLHISFNLIINCCWGRNSNFLILILTSFIIFNFLSSCLISYISNRFFYMLSISLRLDTFIIFFRRALWVRIFDRAYLYFFSVFYLLFINNLRSSYCAILKFDFNIFQSLFHLINIIKWFIYFLFRA